MNKLLLLSLISLSLAFKACDEIYKCLDETTMPEVNHTAHELCEWKQRPKNGTGPDIIYVKRCKDGYECDDLSDSDDDYPQSNSDSDKDYNDEFEYCFPATYKNISGDKCENHTNCFSNNCVNGKCEPVENGQTCRNHGACGKNSFCNRDKICEQLYAPNAACDDDVQCPFGYVCGKLGIENKKCLMMYSQPRGQQVNEDELCESGKEEDNVCVDKNTGVTGESKADLKKCTSDDDCRVTIETGSQTFNEKGDCECTHEGNTYCELGSDSYQWKRFVDVFRKTVEEYKEGDIHVAVHRENDWNVIPLLYEAQLLTDVENVDMPVCAIEFMINATSSLAGSTFLKIGTVFILSIIGVLF